ncbi:MAG: hypothetical protein ABI175_02365 [Polyangiales bacterium]
MKSPLFATRVALGFALLVLAPSGGNLGCSATEGTTPQPIDDTAVPDDTLDASEAAPTDTASDGALPPARRVPCLDRAALATDLPGDAFGALEGELVSIVLPGVKTCPSDSDHVHLQVEAAGKRYDVAITIDSTAGGAPIALLTKDLAATTAPPGWSGAGFDYQKDLGISSADYKAMTKSELVARLQAELATASLVSIHGRSYTDGTGLHNVHRNGGGRDGVILVRRAGPGGTDHAIALRFATDVF